jgi:hypothetical protein
MITSTWGSAVSFSIATAVRPSAWMALMRQSRWSFKSVKVHHYAWDWRNIGERYDITGGGGFRGTRGGQGGCPYGRL